MPNWTPCTTHTWEKGEKEPSKVSKKKIDNDNGETYNEIISKVSEIANRIGSINTVTS